MITCANPRCFRYPARNHDICSRCIMIERAAFLLFVVFTTTATFFVLREMYK